MRKKAYYDVKTILNIIFSYIENQKGTMLHMYRRNR